MKTEFDLESELEKFEQESPSEEGDFERQERVFRKSHEIIQEAMKTVIQEIVIKLNGQSHLVYVHKLNISPSGEVTIEFSTPSEAHKDELYPHVEACVKQQIQSALKTKKKSLWKIF